MPLPVRRLRAFAGSRTVVMPLFLVLSGACTINRADPMPEEMGPVSEGPQASVHYEHPPDQVARAVVSVFVNGEQIMRADSADMIATALSELRAKGVTDIQSNSVDVGRLELEGLIVPEESRYVSEEGGRYVISASVARAAAGTALTIRSIIVATVPGDKGPLGGRILTSNGRLEAATLEAVDGLLRRAP